MFLSYKKKQKFLLYLTYQLLLHFQTYRFAENSCKRTKNKHSKFNFKYLVKKKKEYYQSILFSHFTRLMVSTINPKAYGTKKAANSNLVIWSSALYPG